MLFEDDDMIFMSQEVDDLSLREIVKRKVLVYD